MDTKVEWQRLFKILTHPKHNFFFSLWILLFSPKPRPRHTVVEPRQTREFKWQWSLQARSHWYYVTSTVINKKYASTMTRQQPWNNFCTFIDDFSTYGAWTFCVPCLSNPTYSSERICLRRWWPARPAHHLLIRILALIVQNWINLSDLCCSLSFTSLHCLWGSTTWS